MGFSDDYLNQLRKLDFGGIVKTERERFEEKLNEIHKKFIEEKERLKDYKHLEGFSDSFEGDLFRDILKNDHNPGYIRGSFMEYAAPHVALVQEAFNSIEKQIGYLEKLNPGVNAVMAREVFDFLKGKMDEFDHLPLHKLRDGTGKRLLSELSADINALHVFVNDHLKKSR